MDAIAIAGSGLQASYTRLTAHAANIANASTTGAIPGGAGAPAGPGPYQPVRAQLSAVAGGGVASAIVPATSGYGLAFDPTAPFADAQGMVATPAVSVTDELVGQLAARQDYRANLAVLRTARAMDRATLELWA